MLDGSCTHILYSVCDSWLLLPVQETLVLLFMQQLSQIKTHLGCQKRNLKNHMISVMFSAFVSGLWCGLGCWQISQICTVYVGYLQLHHDTVYVGYLQLHHDAVNYSHIHLLKWMCKMNCYMQGTNLYCLEQPAMRNTEHKSWWGLRPLKERYRLVDCDCA